MKKINKIRSRIKGTTNKNKVFEVLSIFMICISLFLGFMIYAKKDQNGKFLKENFGISTNFTSFNTKVNSFVNSLFNYDLNPSKNNDQSVSNHVLYVELGNDFYSSESNEVNVINNGVVLGVFEDNFTYTVLINFDNGVVGCYSNLTDSKVKQYDRLKKGESLGHYEQSFKALFKKDDKIITYNEAF